MINDDQLDKVLAKINKTSVAHDYFFNSINNPAWLVPLKEKGFFKHPTPAIRQDGYIQFPVWSESGYLARIADKAEDDVLAIIKDLPDTDNERVMNDVVDALLKIDPSKAVRLTETVKKYINSSRFLLLHDSASKFISKFADAGKTHAALALAKDMLEVLPDPEMETKLKERYVMIKPTTKYRDYDYKTIVENITPSLARVEPLGTIDMYSELLQNAIAYESTIFKEADEEEAVVEEKQDDLSWIWRPKIAKKNEDNDDADNILTTALLECVVALMKDINVSDVEKLARLKTLAANKYYVFKRIVEFSLRDYKDNPAFKPFYDSLISDEKLKHILEGEKNNHGVIETGFVTETATDILKDLSDDQLIETLKTYKSEAEWTFERESVAQELSELIKLNPRRFVPLIKDIATTKSEYFSEAVRAFADTIDSLTEDDVIKLFTALTDIYTFNGATEEKERHDYYQWSKNSAIDLAEKLLSQREDKTEHITTKSLNAITTMLLLLCRDGDPASGDHANFEPVDLSINSTRGKAMHSLAYLLVFMNRNKVDKELYKPIFDELDWHLQFTNDPIGAVRAVYGWRFPTLHFTDEEWATKNIDTIFSNDELGNAAFDANMMFNAVHPEALTIMGDVFKRQLPRLAVAPPEDAKARHNGLKNFVQHLALHYWYGNLELTEGSLIDVLLKTADAKYIKELTNFVGFRLYKGKATKTKKAELKKLIALWEAVVKLSQEDDTKVIALEEFGTWFASGKFDPSWSLEQLTYAASKAQSIHLDFAALEYMETLATEYPVEALKALSAMIDGTKERWAVSSWSKNTTAILQKAYGSDDVTAQQTAKALANKLVNKGHLEYRNII